MTRRRRAASALLAVGALLALAVPATAEAHARLLRSSPAAGAVLPRQPDSVVFYFNERVESSFASIRVYDTEGREVEAGSAFRPPNARYGLAMALQPNLPQGTYRAVFRLISVDSHPVTGRVDFSIGRPSTGTFTALPPERDTGRLTQALFWLVRWLGFAAIGIAVGGLFFLVQAWRPALAVAAGGGGRRLEASAAFSRRFRLLLVSAVAAGIVTSLLSLPLEGASGRGVPVWHALGGGVLGDVVDTRFGSLMLVRAAAWALLGGILLFAAGRRTDPSEGPSLELMAASMLPIGSLLISPALAGHARTQSPGALLIPADVVHVTAMSLWLGGLVALAFAVPAAVRRLEAGERGSLLLGALSRFSGVALVSVAALAVSGTAQAVVEVGSVGAFVDSGYGRAVLAKVLLLLVLIGFGAANRRRLLPALGRAVAAATGPGRVEWSLRRNVRIEAGAIAVVLGVAAVLVAMAPAATDDLGTAAPKGRTVGLAILGEAYVQYTVDPARVGRNQLNLFLIEGGNRKPYRKATAVRATYARQGDQGAPHVAALEPVGGRSHYADTAAQFDRTGTWVVTVSARLPGGPARTSFEVPIG